MARPVLGCPAVGVVFAAPSQTPSAHFANRYRWGRNLLVHYSVVAVVGNGTRYVTVKTGFAVADSVRLGEDRFAMHLMGCYGSVIGDHCYLDSGS